MAKNMKWNYDEFVIPEQVKKDWAEIGKETLIHLKSGKNKLVNIK